MKLHRAFLTFFTHQRKLHAFHPQECQIVDLLNLRALSFGGAKSHQVLSVSQAN